MALYHSSSVEGPLLHAKIDFTTNEMKLFEDQRSIQLETNSAGQFTIPLLGETSEPMSEFQEVMMSDPVQAQVSEACTEPVAESGVPPCTVSPCSTPHIEPSSVPSASGQPKLQMWSRVDQGLRWFPLMGKQGPKWEQVVRRVVINLETNEEILNQEIDPKIDKRKYLTWVPDHAQRFRTEFWFRPQEPTCQAECLSVRHMRQLASQVKQATKLTKVKGKVFLVAEVFSPPRFAKTAEHMGFHATSYDLKNGFDFRNKSDRDQVEQELANTPPALLVLCPPCTHEGGWFHLNKHRMPTQKFLQLSLESRSYVKWCCKLFEKQVSSGGQAIFEHPSGSQVWRYPEMLALIRKYHWLKCHMCRFGLQLPGHTNLIRKSTGLLVSHASMSSLALTCPGKSDPHHTCHDTVAGHHSEVGPVSVFAGQYTPQFVEHVLQTVPAYAKSVESALVCCELTHPSEATEVLATTKDALGSTDEETLKKAIDKLHRNLGHPSNSDLVRILKHGGAHEQALELARQFSCQFCRSQGKPRVPLPAQTHRVASFNQCVGIDVKYLPGWLPNQKIKALNIVDQGSCYQLMIPFHERETSQLLADLFDQHWTRWAGPPVEVVLDPAPTMLGDRLQHMLENQGVVVRTIAAEAHWQLGRTENHGGWFARVLSKMIATQSPSNKTSWEACVRHAHVKNQMIQSYGYTPHQHVFGRNPNIPGDLLSEPLHVISGTASLTEQAVQQAQALRTAARLAVIQTQDDKAIRQALAARPRVCPEYQSGDLVAYWRAQKQNQGTVLQGGQWYGTAVVIGRVGRNLIIAHRRQIFRCAPEQLRPATTEERTLISTPEAELLGIKDLIEGGTFKSHQYVDLVPGMYPQTQEGLSDAVVDLEAMSPAPESTDSMPAPAQSPPRIPEIQASQSQAIDPPAAVEPMVSHDQGNQSEVSQPPPTTEGTYGPLRRVKGKSVGAALFRPPVMKEDDFVEVMRDLVPRLLDDALPQQQDTAMSSSSTSHGTKRDLEDRAPSPEPKHSRSDGNDEVLCVQEVSESWEHGIEMLIAAHLQKKTAKELPPSKNVPELQKLVDESKLLEWRTMLEKGAVKVHYGKRAESILREHPDRFIGSRFVITRKATEEGKNVDVGDPSSYKVKSRWCLQGHLDPDLEVKAATGALQSPTLSQPSRVLLMQLLVSFGWDLQLGDIKGAFLEAGPLEAKYRPLFAKIPQGGIPSVPSNAVIEVLGNIYGQNDAPSAWYRTFDSEALKAGWLRSKLDPCLYTLREAGQLVGIMGVHVDDTAVGGMGPTFTKAIDQLKSRFPYRKWRIGEGEFCGSFYSQNPKSKEITMSQQQFAETLRAASLPKNASSEQKLDASQLRVLRGINGSLNWISSQSRPDVAVQTSLSQQCFPNPTVGDLREANNAVRRVKQHKDLCIKFQKILPTDLTLCCHSDAAWANVGVHTQAGFIIGFVSKQLHEGMPSPWVPAVWKSYRMPRAVSSTLSGEAQAMATASGTAEWLSLLMSEVLDGPIIPQECRQLLSRRSPIYATDCKSLYDHLVSPSAPTSIDDRRTSIDGECCYHSRISQNNQWASKVASHE